MNSHRLILGTTLLLGLILWTGCAQSEEPAPEPTIPTHYYTYVDEEALFVKVRSYSYAVRSTTTGTI